MDISEWRTKNSKVKSYAHFDKRVSVGNDFVWNYITNPENISRHGFYPFIAHTQNLRKYKNDNGKDVIIPKERPICYSAHIDRCIFQYYSFLLNQIYNDRVAADDINSVAIAYRNNLTNQNNITFAKKAIDYIKLSGDCFVMIGDFSSFFDNLDHNYLKRRLCDLLGVDLLPSDYYAVFKNVIRYSEWDINDLLEINGLEKNSKGIRELNKRETVLSTEDFKKHKKQYLKRNVKCGIPQGSAISAVLANIYMLDADKQINNFVKSFGGLYMRYSDDFIIILPKITGSVFDEAYKWIMTFYKNMPGVVLSPEKTKIYHYQEQTINYYTTKDTKEAPSGKPQINFLGFSFDGKSVSIRAKAISKYYYRLHKKAKVIVDNGFISPTGKRISCRNLYMLYSCKGAKPEGKHKGNFITYVNRAYRIFNNDEAIKIPVRKHMRKIRKALNKLKS